MALALAPGLSTRVRCHVLGPEVWREVLVAVSSPLSLVVRVLMKPGFGSCAAPAWVCADVSE
eukprot:8431055-Pyramimonas_sp.AAC.1